MPKDKPVKNCDFKQNKDNLFSVSFNKLTQGEVYALINALRIARKASPVAADLSAYLSNALYLANPEIKSGFYIMLTEEIDVEPISSTTLENLNREISELKGQLNNFHIIGKLCV